VTRTISLPSIVDFFVAGRKLWFNPCSKELLQDKTNIVETNTNNIDTFIFLPKI
jgi:hypothetical protein